MSHNFMLLYRGILFYRREANSNSEDAWVFTGEYWNKRKDPGFINMTFEKLW